MTDERMTTKTITFEGQHIPVISKDEAPADNEIRWIDAVGDYDVWQMLDTPNVRPASARNTLFAIDAAE